MPIQKKGDIAEAFALAGIRLRGGSIVRRGKSLKDLPPFSAQLSSAGARAKPDFVVRRAWGKIEIVEAKFGKARLSNPQRALQDDLGSAFHIVRVTIDDITGPVQAFGAVAAVWFVDAVLK